MSISPFSKLCLLSCSLVLVCLVGCNASSTQEQINSSISTVAGGASRGTTGPDTSSSEGTRTSERIKSNCLIQSQRSVKLKAEIGGRIDLVSGAQGQFVRSGQILAKINTVDLTLESQRLVIAIEQSTTKLNLLVDQIKSAQKVWDTIMPLYYEGLGDALPKEAAVLREKKLELAATKFSIKDLELQLSRVKRNIDQAYIRSPMDGVVSLRNAEVGMLVVPGASSLTGSDVLFEVADPKNLRAECSARESDSPNILPGAAVELRLDSNKARSMSLEISRVAPIIQNEASSSSVLFWVDFERPQDLFVIQGMHATATVNKKTSP